MNEKEISDIISDQLLKLSAFFCTKGIMIGMNPERNSTKLRPEDIAMLKEVGTVIVIALLKK